MELRRDLFRWLGMTNDDIAATIKSQIDQIERQMRAHRRVIKHNLDKTLVIEAAETELKALATRLNVLKGNLAKLQPALTKNPALSAPGSLSEATLSNVPRRVPPSR